MEEISEVLEPGALETIALHMSILFWQIKSTQTEKHFSRNDENKSTQTDYRGGGRRPRPQQWGGRKV